MSDRPVPRPSLWVAVWSAARVVLTAAVVLVTYFLTPIGRDRRGWLELVLGLLLVAGVVVLQVRRILRSRRPVVQAAEALTLSALLFLVLFAGTYYALESSQPGSFSQTLTKLDALYFTVTVFATVGFGDISATSETARAMVTVQMIVDLVFIGVAIRVLMAVTKQALSRRASDVGESGSG